MSSKLLEKHASDIRRIAGNHGARRLRIFGSQAKGSATGTSDLDLLVELDQGRDLLDLIGLKLDLEDLLGCKVDVMTEGSLSPYLRDRILEEARPL